MPTDPTWPPYLERTAKDLSMSTEAPYAEVKKSSERTGIPRDRILRALRKVDEEG